MPHNECNNTRFFFFFNDKNTIKLNIEDTFPFFFHTFKVHAFLVVVVVVAVDDETAAGVAGFVVGLPDMELAAELVVASDGFPGKCTNAKQVMA